MDISEMPEWVQELREKLPKHLLPLLEQRDGAARLIQELPKTFTPESVASLTNEQRAWELAGLWYLNQRRFHEALPIYVTLYDHMLEAQDKTRNWSHKGMPLCWISDCYSAMDSPVLAKRYIMLTLCEDAIAWKGDINPDSTGVYFRLVWRYGLTDQEFRDYSSEMYELSQDNPQDRFFPEWILQELDRNWMTEYPSSKEAKAYSANTRYIKYLIDGLGEPTGKTLERLADYILSCMPGCRTTRRQRSFSTDYDIVCSIDGFEVDFRSELGRYFVCECKDWEKAADFTSLAKFCRVLDSTKSRFGILFSKHGISGKSHTTDAAREQLKVYQDRGMVIVVIEKTDLDYVANGGNFINLLQEKYEKIRLDLPNPEASGGS